MGVDLTEGNIPVQLLRFAFPLFLANVIQQLYNAVDMAVVGRYVGSGGTVGISSGGEMATLVTFMATAFGAAGQIYVSQLYGAKDKRSISQTIGTSLVFMILLALASILICVVFCDVFLTWFNTPPEAFDHAKRYMLVVSAGLPFVFEYNAICGILRGIGESRWPLIFVAAAAVANVVLDVLLVVIIPLETVGAAIATVAAQFSSFVSAAVFLYRNKDRFGLEISWKGMRIVKRHLQVLVELGIPMTAQSALIHGTQIICGAQINSFGLVAAATNSIGNKVQKFINVFTISINNGSGAMIGQNLGARKIDRVKKIVHTTVACACVFSGIAALLVIFLPRQMFALFTSDSEVIELGVTYLKICLIVFALAPVQGTFGAVVTGSGHSKLSFFAGLLDGVILRLGISFFAAYTLDMGVTGFFWGNALARLGPVVVNSAYYFSGKWKTRKLLMDQR